MIFKHVEMQNFMAIKNAELNLDNRGLVLIEGVNKSNDSFVSNGASKTSLITSITYALYGRTEKGLKADEVVNNIEKKDTFVKLTFTIGEDEYRIERYRKHKKFKNKVLLFCNGNEITGSTTDVTDKQILDLFGIEFNAYVNAIMYGQGDIPMFSQATDKGKKEILESITNVDIYRKAQEVAKQKIQEVNTRQLTIQNEITLLNNNISFLQRQEQEEKSAYESRLAQRALKEQELNTLVNTLEQKEQHVQSRIGALKEGISDTTVGTYSFSEEYSTNLENQKKYSESITKLELKRNELNIHIQNENSALSRLDTADTCPVCGSPIDNSHRVQEGELIRGRISKLQEAVKTLDTHLETFKNLKLTLDEAINAELLEQQKHQSAIAEEYKKQDSIKSQISELERSLDSDKSKIQMLKGSLEAYDSLEKPVGKQEEISSVKSTIDTYSKEVLELEQKKTRYTQALDAFSNKGIRSVVLGFITPFLNEKANEYLGVLSGSDISVEFQTQTKTATGELRDKFDVVVTNAVGGSTYKSNSAGEQRRIDLAISFAIQDLIMSRDDISTNIALYDECFDGLDLIGCENVVKLLKERLSKVSTIFVISHNENLKPLFENSITMIKENGVSRLEEEIKK